MMGLRIRNKLVLSEQWRRRIRISTATTSISTIIRSRSTAISTRASTLQPLIRMNHQQAGQRLTRLSSAPLRQRQPQQRTRQQSTNTNSNSNTNTSSNSTNNEGHTHSFVVDTTTYGRILAASSTLALGYLWSVALKEGQEQETGFEAVHRILQELEHDHQTHDVPRNLELALAKRVSHNDDEILDINRQHQKTNNQNNNNNSNNNNSNKNNTNSNNKSDNNPQGGFPWSPALPSSQMEGGGLLEFPARTSEQHRQVLRRSKTLTGHLEQAAIKQVSLDDKYRVNWRKPLGEGAFGAVYAAVNRETGEKVAIKKISKELTDHVAFQNEMEALLKIKDNGGHPNICGLQEHYERQPDADDGNGDDSNNANKSSSNTAKSKSKSKKLSSSSLQPKVAAVSQDGQYFYLVLDLVSGGEMFDHLCNQGPYSEADAARLIREVASAMNFVHGIGIVHGDLKPENLMLSSKESAAAVVKVVDFGCASMQSEKEGFLWSALSRKPHAGGTANTPAYSSPEILRLKKGERKGVEASFDMWALGVILYIMLTGVHPFDLYGTATDEEIEAAIVSGKKPPLDKSPLTKHLSQDALNVIENLLQSNPRRRLTAQELLEHPWVRGETASKTKIADSDKRLSMYRAFRTKLQAKAFADMVSFSDSSQQDDNIAKKTSLIERSFQQFDPDHRGYIPASELKRLAGDDKELVNCIPDENLSLSGFSDILSEHMLNKYYPKGHIIYNEGEEGHAMFFLNSGSVEIYTKDGYKTIRSSGEFFGEGALLNPTKTRSASIRTVTPVHAIEISREYFEKYIATDAGVKLNLREKDKQRKRQRAKTLLQLQQNMQPRDFVKGEYLFQKGQKTNNLFMVDEGSVVIKSGDQPIIYVDKGEMVGEHASVFGRPRNVDVQCVSDECKTFVLRARDFYRLLESHPAFKESVREICLRREFQKAYCVKTNRPFPKDKKGLNEAFHLVAGEDEYICLEDITALLKNFDETYSEQDIADILDALDLDDSGRISWTAFEHLFEINKDPTENNKKKKKSFFSSFTTRR